MRPGYGTTVEVAPTYEVSIKPGSHGDVVGEDIPMRWKIIAVNTVIVALVGLLSYALLRASLGDVASDRAELKSDAERSLAAANAKLELDGLRTERWLAAMANDKGAREPLKAGTPSARSEEATDLANKILSAAVGSPALSKMAPALVAVVDASVWCWGATERT